MKKTWLYLFLCFFCISAGFAFSLGLDVNPNEVQMNHKLTIDYHLSFDEAQNFSYKLQIKGPNMTIDLKNEILNSDGAGDTVEFDVGNYPAGDYEVILIYGLFPLPPESFKVLPTMEFETEIEEIDVFCYNDSVLKSVGVENKGNVPLFVSASFTGVRSDVSMIPQTIDIPIGETKAILLSIARPDEHYNATITLEGSWENDTKTVEIPMTVYDPDVVINVEAEFDKEASKIIGTIENAGSVYRDITLIFQLKDTEQTEQITVNAGETFDLDYTFDQKPKSLTVNYIGSDGEEETVVKKFGFTFPGFGGTGLLSDNWIFVVVSLVLIILLVWIIFFRKKKNQTINLSKIGV